MAMKTPEQYIESLRDGRELYMNGQRIEDVLIRHARETDRPGTLFDRADLEDLLESTRHRAATRSGGIDQGAVYVEQDQSRLHRAIVEEGFSPALRLRA